jgi:hypothetical protein
MMFAAKIPFALSLSKGCPSSWKGRKVQEQGFDKLSPNGFEVRG